MSIPLGGAPQAMGMDTVTVAACDTKEVCFRWARRNHEVKHWFNSLEDMLEPYAKCGQCNKQCSTTLGSVDVVIGGLPCQPYSRKRSKRKVGVTQHPAYRVGFDLFFSFLDKHDIAGFIIEEVIGFNDVEATTGQRPLECFVALARQRNFAVQVLVLNAEDWAQVPRQRLIALCMLDMARKLTCSSGLSLLSFVNSRGSGTWSPHCAMDSLGHAFAAPGEFHMQARRGLKFRSNWGAESSLARPHG